MACLTIFYEDKIKAGLLCFSVNNQTGYEKMGYYIHDKYMLRWKDKFMDESLKQFKYYRYYIVFGCTAVVENWVRGGMKETTTGNGNNSQELPTKRKNLFKIINKGTTNCTGFSKVRFTNLTIGGCTDFH